MPSEPILVNSSISSTGDITAVKFYGDGSGLVNITTTNLPNPRIIAATGDATWSVTFDGTQDVSGTLTLANSGVTAGTYTKVTVDAKGRVTTGANLVAGDLPSHTHTIAQISDGSVLVKTTDTATVTNTMLAGGIANNKLSNSSITLNGVSVSLGGTATIPSSSAGTLTIGSYLTGGSYNGSGNVTIAANASSANTSSTLVARDASGNFSAGIITATLNGLANNISQYVVNQDVGLTSSPTFSQVNATTSLRASGTSGLLYLNRAATSAVSEVHFQTASATDWKLGTRTTSSPNIAFATSDNIAKLTLSQSGILTVSGGITGVRYPRPSVNCNLGNPTVEEIAMFGAQMSNKIRGVVPYIQEESTDGTTWTTSTRLTASQLAGIVVGDGNVFGSPVIIPITTVGSSGHYRLTWDAANTGYVWLNALYFYISTKGSNVTVKLEIYNNIAASWSTVVTGTVNGWPNHGYIPHDSIVFSTSLTEASAHRYARVTFSLASSAHSGSQYGGIELSSMEWMGGYPAGRRNVEYHDSSLNAHWTGSVFASSFVDENDTTYYLDPSSTGTALTVAGAATVGRGIGGGEAIALVLSSAEGGAGGATSIRAFPRGAGGTSNASARIRFTSGTGPSAGIQFYTGGTVGGVTSESLVLTLNQGATSAAFAGDLSVGGNLTVTGSISAASFTGTISNSGTANTLTSLDNRVINPSETSISRAQFGFTSWNNDGGSPYADYLHLRSYLDASGGLDNLVMFRKTGGIGMRIWQQTFGSTDAYSTYKDIAFTDGTNATGTWTLNTSGYAAYIQGSEIALAFAAAPRTSTQPFSVKLFDNYNTAGWPATYGTIMEIYGKVGHQIDQLHFGSDRKIYHRSAFYNENTWTSFQKILEADDTSSTNVANKIVVRDASGNFSAGTITANLTGNASTVTNGVYTTGSYANPAWIASLDASKLTGDQTIPNVVLPGQLRTEQISTTSLAAGAWYTIATNDGNRANGKFIITDATPGLHQSVHFYASHHYGAGNKISIIHNDSYGGGGPVRYIRIKEGGTYDGAMLQIYVDDAVTGALPLRIYLYEDVQANGWTLKNFISDGTDPGGTGNFANLTNVAAQVDLDLGATIFSGNIYSGTATNTGQFKVYNTSDASSLTVQNSLVLRDASGAFSAGSITLTGAPLAIGSGGTNATTAAGARTSLGASIVGSNLFTLADPSAIRFLRLNADNTVSALSAEDFKTAIGAGSGGGSVTSVSGTGSVNGITLTGTVTSSGSLTLGGALSNVSLTSQVTGTLPIANGGTNATTNVAANTNIVNFGQLEPHSTYTDFNTVPSTWGFSYVFGPAANAPHANSSQWYRSRLSLGSGYGIGTTASSYWLELAMPRYSGSSYGNLYFRTTEAGVTGAWYGVRAAYAETAGSVTGGIYTTGDQTITGVKTFNDTIKASRIEASSSTNITLVPAGTSGEVAIRRGSDDNLAFTLRPTGANNGYIRSGSATGIFTVDSNDFRVRSYEQDVDRLRITSTESVFASPLRVTGNLTAGDGLFINTNVASRSYFDANTGAYFHTPGAMVRKDSASNVPGEMPATFVLYNRNGGNDTGTKLVFSSSESSSATSNAVATAAIVSQKVSATDGNWGVGNLRFYVKNVGVYEEVLTLNASKTAAFKGPIQLENNVAQYWLDSTGNSRRVSLVSSGNASYFGPVDAGWGSTTYLSAGTAMILRTNGGGGTFVEAVTLATGGNVTVAKDLIVNGTGGITVSTSSGATPVITATSTNGVAGYFVSDGHLNDLQANTSTHFIIKRSKNTATQNRWAMQLQGGENTSDSPVEGSNLVFVYSSAGTGTWTNGLTLYRNGNALIAGSATTGGALTVNSTITAANTIKYVNSGVANGTVVGPLAADIGADATLGALQVTVGGSPSATGSSRFGYIGAGDVGAWRRIIVGSNNTSGGGQVLVPSTLTSDSTSSGALVVSGGVGIGGSVNVGGTAFGLTNSNNGETGVTVTNTNTGAAAIAKLGTWNGTVGVNLATFSTAYSGRSNESWLYTNAAYALKLGTNNTERIGISSTGEVSISSSLAVNSPSALAAAEVGNFRIVDSSNVNRKLFFGIDNTVAPNGVGYIQAVLTGTTTLPLIIQPNGGPTLFGTSTNSSNGRIQLATHTANTGGIGFGTDVNLYRSAANTLKTDGVFQAAQGVSSGTYLGGQDLYLNNAAGTVRAIYWQTSGSSRWAMYANTGAESGSNAGSNYILSRYSDAGAYLGDALSINRATGAVSLAGNLSSGGVITISGDPTGDRSAITRVWSVSRGENLVTNGSGLMGNNYNFSGLTFDAVQTHGGGGSFRATAAYGSYTSDEFLPVDPEKNYRFALWARSGQDGGVDYSASNLQYAGIVPYDIDGLTVFPFTYAKYPGSTDTTLAATLNPGDTTVTLTSTAGWANTGSANYQRQFGWYGYTNSKGYTYPNYTYTRNYTWNYTVYQGDPAGAWSVGGISGNVITLNAPWPGPTVAAGTAIRNINSGGTFKYITLGATSVPNTWTRYEGYIGGLDTGGTQNTNQFPYGTAFVKLLFLSNYHGVANNTIRFSDLWFSEMSSRNLEPATDTFAGVVSTTTQTFAGSKSFSTDVRAPIFYDSVDTGYWISPRSAQTSSEGGRIKRNFTVNAEGSGTGYGLALYPSYTAQALPAYGIVFGQTGTLGTHGSVSGDWATYFTMNNSSGRGWVFRNSSDGINVASISNTGNLSLNGSLTSTQNSNTVVDGIRIINTNGGTSTAIRNTLNNGAYDGGLWMGGQAFTNNNFYRANRVSLVGPFDLNYVSGQHFFWLGTGGTSNDPTNASQVLTITLGGRMVHSPIAHSTAAWTTLGALNEWRAATVTNSTTAASGTVATAVFNSFGASTLAATNASVTTTNAATVYIAGGPAAGANQTITNSWGLWNVGRTKLTGSVKIDDNSSSYSTASGALVVDGGLGVGGAIYSGNLIVSSGSGAGFAAEPRDGSGYRATWYNPTGDDMQLDFAGIGTKFTITSAGNTTIAGTLTASGATGTFGTSASAGTSLRLISGVGTLVAPKYSTLDFRSYNDLKSGAYIRTGNRESDTNEWLLEIATRSNADVLTQIATFSDTKLSILASTISNSTSSGALVVNGGVGVGGNITVGGQVDLNSGSAAAPSLKLNGTNNGLFYNGSNIVRISANGTLAASIGVSGSEFSGVLTAGSGTHTFGNAAANTVLEVSRITNNPSGIQLQALDSHSLLNFTTSTPGYTWGRIGSNGNEILRIYNAGLTAITAVSGGGLAIGGGLNVNGNATFAGDITISTNTKAFYNTAYANAKGTQVGYFSRGTSGGWTSGIHFDSSNTNYSATFVHDPTSGDLRLYTNSTTSNYTASDIALTVGANRSATFTGSVTVNGTTLRSSNTISIDSGTTANRYDIYRDNSGAVYPIGHLVSYGSQTGYGGFTWANLDSGKLLEITNAGAVTAKTSLTVNRLFAQTRKLEAHVPHTVSTEDYLRIASNSGSTNTYGGEFGYGLTAAGDPEVRFNRVHAGTVTNWLTVPTNTGNATFAGSITTNTSLGVGTTASGTTGEIRATNNVTAYYSDERLKTKLGGIEDPLKKVMSLSGFYFAPNDTAMALGYQKKVDVGVSAQEVQKVLPEIIAPAPIDPQYMTVRYEKMIPLLIEAIKEQQSQIEELKNLVAKLTNK